MKDKNRGKMRLVVPAVLLAIVGVGITLAYLTATSEDKVNSFKVLGSEDIDTEIEEPNWPGEEKVVKILPGSEVDKDPFMVNTSDQEIDIYVGMQVVLVNGGGSSYDPADILEEEQYEELMKWLLLRYDTDLGVTNYNAAVKSAVDFTADSIWVDTQQADQDGNGAIFVWSQELARDEQTDELFLDVMLKKETANPVLDWMNGTADLILQEDPPETLDALDQFSIVLRGAAIQAEGVDLEAEGIDALIRLLKYW